MTSLDFSTILPEALLALYALLALLDELRAQGITAILISHKLNEISKIADSITVLRDGATVAHHDSMVSEE